MRRANLLAAVLLIGSPVRAWHDEGHHYAAVAAVEALAVEGDEALPAFLREGMATIAHCALDPDVHGERSIAIARDAEAPNHYLDLEMLRGRPLPPTRHGFIRLCEELDIEPDKAGYLPWAIEEWTQKLAAALAEHRRWPDNPHIRAKALVYAGHLAHYAADLHMPLHTSVHFDGRATLQADGTWSPSPRTGIHARVDALPTKLPFNAIFSEPLTLPEDRPELGKLAAYIEAELRASHALVDQTYALEPALPPVEAPTIDDPALRAFTIDRMRASATMVATLIDYAWRLSGLLHDKGSIPPFWLDRGTFDGGLDRDAVPPQPAR